MVFTAVVDGTGSRHLHVLRSRGRGHVRHFRLWLAHLENRKRDTATDVSSHA
jgi:hypothetical protein